jgi:hypothetical protein
MDIFLNTLIRCNPVCETVNNYKSTLYLMFNQLNKEVTGTSNKIQYQHDINSGHVKGVLTREDVITFLRTLQELGI